MRDGDTLNAIEREAARLVRERDTPLQRVDAAAIARQTLAAFPYVNEQFLPIVEEYVRRRLELRQLLRMLD